MVFGETNNPGFYTDSFYPAGRADAAPDLQRHLALVLHILNEIHGGHPTASQLSLDVVAVSQGGVQALHLLRLIPHAVFLKGAP